MWLELQARVSPEMPLVIPRLKELAASRGFALRIDDEAALDATGAGRIEIEAPDIDEQGIAHAAVQALIDEVPGGPETFTIV